MRRSLPARYHTRDCFAIFLNANGNARQMVSSAKTSDEHCSSGHLSHGQVQKQEQPNHSQRDHSQHDHSQQDHTQRDHSQRDHSQHENSQRDLFHSNVAEDMKKIPTAAGEIKDLNYILMRENIEKMKRIKILKMVKCSFENMFFRVQELTDGLKTQLDEVLIEHRKANKMVHNLHKHVSGMKGDIEGLQCDLTNTIDMEETHVRGRTHQRFNLTAIESVSSSRTSSLPDVFKVDSSDKDHAEEELRVSKTRNIRKIAVKKSQEKSLTETNGRKISATSINRESSAIRGRNSLQATLSSKSISSMRKNDAGMESVSPEKLLKVAHKNAKTPAKDLVLKTIPGIQQENILPDSKETVKTNRVAESLVLPPISDRRIVTQKHTNSVIPFDQDFKNKRQTDSRIQTKPVRKVPKYRKEQMIKDIKNIEECIIQPKKVEKESLKIDSTVNSVRKQPGRKKMNFQHELGN